jgi:hypothetical protein
LQEDISLLLGMAMDTGLVTEEMFAQIEGKVQALVSESVSDVRTHTHPIPELDAPFEDINH